MKVRPLRGLLARMPIKWKLTLWSAAMMFLLFAAYNAVQYFYIERWITKQAELAVQQNMRAVLNYLLEREAAPEAEDLAALRGYLHRINQSDQLIRILDENGKPLVAVASDMPEDLVAPAAVAVPEQLTVRHDRQSLLVMRSPITIFQFGGTVEIIRSTREFNRLSAAYSRVMIVFGLIAVLLFGLGGGVIAGQLLKPLQSLAATIANIRRNGLQERVPAGRKRDELTALMRLFNAMMDDVERSFAQQRQFVEDASHELRTPIAIMEGHLALLRRWGKHDPAVLEEALDISAQELGRLKRLVEELLALTRAERERTGEEAAQTVPLAGAVRRVLKHVAPLHPDFDFRDELAQLAGASIEIDPVHLEQIVLILLDNAVKYSGMSRVVTARGWLREGRAWLALEDRGIGIPAGDLPHVTDRFYRADKARSRERDGYGLGLAIAGRLVARYGGTMAIESREGEGTTVSLSFPAAAD